MSDCLHGYRNAVGCTDCQDRRIMQSHLDEAGRELADAEDELARLRAQLDKAMAALRPFAHFGRFCQPDDENYDDDKIFSSVHLKCGMFRIARRTLAELEAGGQDDG